MYSLRQDNHGENVSVQWLMKNRIYILRQDNHGENVSVQWFLKIRIAVLSKAGQPRRECQCSVVNEK